jgi:2-polyprenyl-3-methyl-5-hydroxy-6-metoxy-1,4-benzoquinol methylase
MDQIMELSRGVDESLRKLLSFKELLEEVKASLDKLKDSQEQRYLYELQKLRDEVSALRSSQSSSQHNLNPSDLDFEEIKRHLKEGWPEAVDPSVICEDQEKETKRAVTILDLVVNEDLTNQKFLDYGCGHGHVVNESSERGTTMSVGYDINPQWQFHEGKPNMFFADTFSQVADNGPYDTILLFDVLDHIEGISPVEALQQVKSVLAPNGKVYIRNHPWSSRHGGHLYSQNNAAYLHLVLDEVELTRLESIESQHNIKVLRPLKDYGSWIKASGLEITSELPLRKDVEEFFTRHSIVREKIERHYQPDEVEHLSNILSIEFVEYVLTNPIKKVASDQKIF